MKLIADIRIPAPPAPLQFTDKILLMGSCFTTSVGELLAAHKFTVLQNPTGILFDPLSICRHLHDLLVERRYTHEELFEQAGVWHSLQHHSDFSATRSEDALNRINKSIADGKAFLARADVLILTFGSAFSYQLSDNGQAVANCHKLPGDRFRKHLCTAAEIGRLMQEVLAALRTFNPALRIILTVSPVRHLRDGLAENNRSKAQLIEAVHRLCENDAHLYYFPAYELVIDVLRDYRWFSDDLAHPNAAATQYVFDRFMESALQPANLALLDEIKDVLAARRHRPQFPGTEAHRAFLEMYLQKTQALLKRQPGIDWSAELAYFSGK